MEKKRNWEKTNKKENPAPGYISHPTELTSH